MTRRRTWVVNGVLVVVLGGAGFGIYEAFAPASSSAQATTRSTQVTRTTVTETVSAAGTVASSYTGAASFGTSGKVASIDVAVGDVVTAGQKLATLDSTQASKQLQVAKANLEVADENLTTFEDTPAPTTSSKTGTQASTSGDTTTSLQAKIDQAQLDVDTAQSAVDDTVLTAPGAGTVTAINGTVGQAAGSGSSSSSSGQSASTGSGSASGGQSSSAASSSSSSSTTSGFITLTNMSNLVVDSSVAEIDVSKVKVGQKATVTLNALPDTPIQATVSKVNLTPTTSGSVVSYGTELTLTSPPAGLRPGQSASVAVTVAQADNALSVPAAAVQTVGTSNIVVVDVNGQNVPRQVQVGVRGASTIQITSGLTDTDRVVLTGASPTATGGARTGGTGAFGGTGGLGGTGGTGGFGGGTRTGGTGGTGAGAGGRG